MVITIVMKNDDNIFVVLQELDTQNVLNTFRIRVKMQRCSDS